MAKKLNRDRVCAAYNRLMDKGDFRSEECDALATVIGNGFQCADSEVADINALADAVLA